MKKLFITFSFLSLFLSTTLYPQWYQQYSGAYTNLYSFFSIDGTTSWATGANGVIIKTTNSGVSWIQKPSNTSYSISFVHFFNYNEGIVAGSGGTIKKTYDGGETWESIYGGTYNRLQEGCFVNDSVGYICGDAGILLKTTDRGNTWITSVIAASNFAFIYFVNENTGLATTEYTGQIWKTTDAGNNWSLKQVIGNYSIWQIHFVDENNGWVVGEYGTIAHTTNGGESWNLQYSGTGVNLRSVYFHTPDVGWVVGKDEKRLRTTNGGNTWTHDHTGYSYEYLYIYFFNNDIGWIIGTSGVIMYTDNGGVPVELVNFSGHLELSEIVLEWTTATETNNSGFEIERRFDSDDWQIIGFVPGHGSSTERHSYQFFDHPNKNGNYTYRLKQIDFDGTFEYSDEVAIEFIPKFNFILEQNYPNPFNPTTTFQYSIPDRQFVTLRIYNSLGEIVSEPINEVRDIGIYELKFDASDLPSGIYFYRLISGNNIETRKMVLVK